jgi:hypothetical protein
VNATTRIVTALCKAYQNKPYKRNNRLTNSPSLSKTVSAFMIESLSTDEDVLPARYSYKLTNVSKMKTKIIPAKRTLYCPEIGLLGNLQEFC